MSGASPVRRAVVPAAGRGTRMRPASLAYPKELVALGATPALQRVIAEAEAAGIEEVALVVRPGKELLRRFLDRLRGEGRFPALSFTWIEQREATGLADALLLCRDFVEDEPWALLLPDNLPLASDYRLTDLTRHAGEGREVYAVVELDHRRSGEYGDSGRVEVEPRPGGTLEILSLAGKRPGRLDIPRGETIHRACGRTVASPHLIPALAESRRRRPGGELSEVPACRALVRERGALGVPIPEPIFDVGHPPGVLAASAWLHRRGGEPEP